jgi:hypothetical protein
VQGVKKRGMIGTASQEDEALKLGNAPAALAKMAVDVIRGRQ